MANKKIGMILAGVSLMAVVTAQAGGGITNMGVRGTITKVDGISGTSNTTGGFMDFGAKLHGVGANIKLDYLGTIQQKEVSLFTKVGNAKLTVGRWRPHSITGSDKNAARNDWMWDSDDLFVGAKTAKAREGGRVSMGVQGFDVDAEMTKKGAKDIYGLGVKGHAGQVGFNAGYQVWKQDGADDEKAMHVAGKFGTHGVGLVAAYEKDDDGTGGEDKFMGIAATTKLQGFGLKASYGKHEKPSGDEIKLMSIALGKEIQKNVKAEIGAQKHEEVGTDTTTFGASLSANF